MIAAPPQKNRVLLAAGGTGGHINPAIALAQVLRELAPEVEVQFICGCRPAEWQIYRRQDIQPWVLPIGAQRRGFAARFKSFSAQFKSYFRARQLLRATPVQVAVGFGSYASVAAMLAAHAGGARLVLHEQNVKPGLANRLLGPLATRIATADPLNKRRGANPKYVHVGNPVREGLLRPVNRGEARAFFRLRPERPVCLIIGGSQGAAGLNRLLLDVVQRISVLDHPAAHWQMLWSTGPVHYESVVKWLTEIRVDPAEHSINPYIDEMAMAYAAADLVLGRAGALTLAEITALGKPAVLIPLPTSAGGHQESNARAMVASGAAELLSERDPLAVTKLETLLTRFAREPDTLKAMGNAALRLGKPEAARELAEVVLKLL